ncbi:MAG: hypothetical protein IMY75_06415 [Chloroflexi bacterium]|nr:hypothetical protein [Chloroflexota bacterium]
MTSKQRRIIAVLAVANTIVILALVVLVTRPSSTHLSPSPHSPTPTLPHSPTPQQETCQWRATQLLAQAGLGGTVVLTPDGSLRFEITYPLAPGQVPEEAAQLVWTVFDVALALDELAGSGGQEAGSKNEDTNGSFTQVEVTILAQGIQTDTQVSATVSAADLAAFGAGELGEDEFIERVVYSIGKR